MSDDSRIIEALKEAAYRLRTGQTKTPAAALYDVAARLEFPPPASAAAGQPSCGRIPPPPGVEQPKPAPPYDAKAVAAAMFKHNIPNGGFVNISSHDSESGYSIIARYQTDLVEGIPCWKDYIASALADAHAQGLAAGAARGDGQRARRWPEGHPPTGKTWVHRWGAGTWDADLAENLKPGDFWLPQPPPPESH